MRNNVPIEEAIQDVFEKGCLILLDSINALLQEELVEQAINDKFEFSPSLSFNDEIFNRAFWDELSKL